MHVGLLDRNFRPFGPHISNLDIQGDSIYVVVGFNQKEACRPLPFLEVHLKVDRLFVELRQRQTTRDSG